MTQDTFTEERNRIGTYGVIQLMLMEVDIPEDIALMLLTEMYEDFPMRKLEGMADEFVYSLILGMQLGWEKYCLSMT